eukprot:13675549-Alexandrium_andersonii.AAC.1
MVGVVKETAKKIRNSNSGLDPAVVMSIAASANNEMEKVKGFTPAQWAYGHVKKLEFDPVDANRDSNFEVGATFWDKE